MKLSKNKIRRRSFLKGACLAAPLLMFPRRLVSGPAGPGAQANPAGSATLRPVEFAADLVVIGGGLGGCAAALAAARNHLRVLMTEETDWIGGQMTQQAVPPDENQWIETIGGTRSYLALRQKIRDYYVRNYPLTAAARAKLHLNPGNSWVSRLTHEPRVSLAVLWELFAPYLGNGQVQILLRHKAFEASVTGERVEAIRVRDLESGHEKTLRAPYFVDATELGDLLPMTGTEYVSGAEAKSDTGEPHAAEKANPQDFQGFTMCFAMDYLAGEDHTIAKPADYAFWHDLIPKEQRCPDCRLLSFDDPDSKKIGFDPAARKGFWTYRRIADRDNFEKGFYPGDVTIVNWPQNDYWFGSICDVPAEEAARNVARARQQSLSLLYWLQTEAPRPDGGAGWKGLRLRPDMVGTEDGLAKHPYIREGRRIRALFTVLEQHVAAKARMEATGLKPGEATAEPFKDSVGIGHYSVDIHTTTAGISMKEIKSLPFQIPLGALIPQRVQNLLPGCKNIGVTHITNGCYRLHPIEWNIGESVGETVAFCLSRKCAPREVRERQSLLANLQSQLTGAGVPLAWPKSVLAPAGKS